VQVSPNLIRRSKTHFYALANDLEMILGLNGLIWVYQGVASSAKLNEEEDASIALDFYSSENDVLCTVDVTKFAGNYEIQARIYCAVRQLH
jgi:exosome complex RNA-binding protein Rrp4